MFILLIIFKNAQGCLKECTFAFEKQKIQLLVAHRFYKAPSNIFIIRRFTNVNLSFCNQ